jgi:ATP-dependent Lhr-like helicase
MENQLEVSRTRATLERAAMMDIALVRLTELSPFAFPIWAERLRETHHTSEQWSDRVRAVAERLEEAMLSDVERAAADGVAPISKRRKRSAGRQQSRGIRSRTP